MDEPVAVLTPFPALKRGLASMLAETIFAPEVPDDPNAWVAVAGNRVVLMAVARVGEMQLVVDLRLAEDLVVVALLPEITPETVREAILAGACAVAGWDTSSDELVALLTAAVESRSILPTHLLQALATVPDKDSKGVELDQEQVEWLRALAKGMTVNQLAESISYSEREVYRLLRALYDRLGVGNRTEALIWAAQRGIVE